MADTVTRYYAWIALDEKTRQDFEEADTRAEAVELMAKKWAARHPQTRGRYDIVSARDKWFDMRWKCVRFWDGKFSY